jgi:hypothetical protein
MTTQTRADRTASAAADEAKATIDDAKSTIDDAIGAVRSTGSAVGERLPEVLETVQTNAKQGVETLRSWPEPTRKLAASFSLGLGIGLAVAGAPRLVVAAALAPAIIVGGMYASRIETA